MAYKLIVFLINGISLITTLSCDARVKKTLQNELPKTFKVSYSQTHNWISYYMTASIDQEGHLTVQENNFVSGFNRYDSYQINEEELKGIQVLLMDLRKVELDELYTIVNEGITTTDLPTNILTYNIDGKTSQTEIHGSGGGNKLNKLTGKINKLCTKYYGSHP